MRGQRIKVSYQLSVVSYQLSAVSCQLSAISCQLSVVICLLILSGCATVVGPAVSRQEIDEAREELQVKARQYQIKQLERVNNVADKVIASVDKDDVQGNPAPALGIEVAGIDKYLKKLYELSVDKGVVAVVVKDNSVAAAAGIRPGDVIVSVAGKKITDENQYKRLVSKLKIGDAVTIDILRKDADKTVNLKVGAVAVNIPVIMVDMQEVNAATDGKYLYITKGLMYFIKSDDELAAVIAHELAHAVRGHVSKMQGTQVIGAILSLVLGSIAESGAPGTGEGVARGVGYISNVFSAGYSRDLEREADYFSVKFVYRAGYDAAVCVTLHERFAIEIPASMVESYLSTHPSSPERAVRIRKIIEELESGKYAVSY